MRGLEQYEGAPVEQIRGATRRALENLVGLTIREAVDFVLIAGDLYDGDWNDYETGLFFVRQAARLDAAGIPLFLISGNHDAANRMTRSLGLPPNVTMFSSSVAETKRLPDLHVAIHGQSFATAAVAEDLSQNYPQAVSGSFNIGMLHTSADGREGHDCYAPCHVDDLKKKGYDYWALGHIHKREVLCEQPWIAFSGNIQGRHIRETGEKGCYLVTVDDARNVSPEFVSLDVMRWQLVSVDVSSANEPTDILELVRESLESLWADDDNLPRCVRVELVGATGLHGHLVSDREHWSSQVRGFAVQITRGDLWIEKVKIRTTEPEVGGGLDVVDEDAWGELHGVFSEFQQEPSSIAEAGFDLGAVVKMLPAELKHVLDADGNSAWLKDVVEEAQSLLRHRLVPDSRS